MKHIIIGTSGHIDHGKTSLIRKLSGIDTDRLKEEKERGITIDLGFAYFDLLEGQKAGIIDVPGHEKFVRNMLAGVSGMDIVLLVIAADEGIMPQTIEHLQILDLLEVKKGIIVLTKKDLVDDDWLFLVEEDIRNGLIGTFLEEAPFIAVSNETGEGIDGLKSMIMTMTDDTEARNPEGDFRYYIDRVFTIKGHGTVVTGTIMEGKVHVGDEVELNPGGELVKIRSIEVHNEKTDVAEAGQRTAMNVTGIKREDLKRGDVLSAKDTTLEPTLITAKVKILKGFTLKHNQRIHLHLGSSEVLGRVRLLDCEVIEENQYGFIQIRTEEPVVIRPRDRFVMRHYSPVITLGGGSVLSGEEKKRKRMDHKTSEVLELMAEGTPQDVIKVMAEDEYHLFIDKNHFIKMTGYNKTVFDASIESLVAQNKMIEIHVVGGVYYTTTEKQQKAITIVMDTVTAFHRQNPLKTSMPKEELRSRTEGLFDAKLLEALLNQLRDRNLLHVQSNSVSESGFSVSVSETEQALLSFIDERMGGNDFYPIAMEELLEKFSELSEKTQKELLKIKIEEGSLVKLTENYYLTQRELQEVLKALPQLSEITLANLRDAFTITRKSALPILEYCDRQKITKRVGENLRILL